LVLQAIAEQQGLAVTEDQVDTSIREAFGADGDDNRASERALRQPEIRERVRTSLIEEQTTKWLVEHATAAPEAKPRTRKPAPAPQEQQS